MEENHKMALEDGLKRGAKAIGFAGALAVSALGCRAQYEKVSPGKEKVYAIEAKEDLSASQPLGARVKNIDTLVGSYVANSDRSYALENGKLIPVSRKAVPFDFGAKAYEKMLDPEAVKTAGILNEKAAQAERACIALNAEAVRLYGILNKMSEEDVKALLASGLDGEKVRTAKNLEGMLRPEQLTVIRAANDEMREFGNYFIGEARSKEGQLIRPVTPADVAWLNYKAKASKDNDLIKATSEMLGAFEARSLALARAQQEVNNFFMSEGMYGGKRLAYGADVMLAVEGIANGLDAKRVGNSVIDGLGLRAEKNKQQEEFVKHIHRNLAVDADHAGREHLYKILKSLQEAFDKEKGRVDGKSARWARIVAVRDFADAADHANPQGWAMKTLRYDIGASLVPFMPAWYACDHTSFVGKANTAIDADDTKEKNFAGVLKRTDQAGRGYTNGDWVYGDGTSININAFLWWVKQAGQVGAAAWGIDKATSGGSTHHHGGGGGHTQTDPVINDF